MIGDLARIRGLAAFTLVCTDDAPDAPWEDILHAAYVDPITGEVVAIRETPVQPF